MPSFFKNRQPSTFRDRTDAGLQLATRILTELAPLDGDTTIVVGLARGGVIVASEVARQLDLRLEAIVVRKLGAPSQPELALGAISASGDQVFNRPLIVDIGLGEHEVQGIIEQATKAANDLSNDIGAPAQIPGIAGATVILVDDGLATGATMRVAIRTVYHQGAKRVIMALPVAPDTTNRLFREAVDEMVILIAPGNLRTVGQWYQDFSEVPSYDVRNTLEANPHRQAQ